MVTVLTTTLFSRLLYCRDNTCIICDISAKIAGLYWYGTGRVECRRLLLLLRGGRQLYIFGFQSAFILELNQRLGTVRKGVNYVAQLRPRTILT